MNRFVSLFAFMLAGSASAFAFDNIEADALYHGPIKDQIRKEFVVGLTLLKDQADRLGMAVRERDITTLQQHMYDKAFLMGRCVDKAITIKKMVSDKILLDKNVNGCIDMHMKFIAWLQSPDAQKGADLIDHFPSYDLRTYAGCRGSAGPVGPNSENPPYDFLIIEKSKSGYYIGGGPFFTMDLHDYVTMRECYRSVWIERYRQEHGMPPDPRSAELDKLFDRLTAASINPKIQSSEPKVQVSTPKVQTSVPAPNVRASTNVTGSSGTAKVNAYSVYQTLTPKDLSSDIYFQMLRKAPGLPGAWFDDASHRSTQPGQQTAKRERPTNQVKAAETLEDQLRDGIAAWLRKDYVGAFQVLRPLATAGNSSAQQLLGQMYNTGDGVPQDTTQAVTWWARAAELGQPLSQLALGDAYAMGRGVSQSWADAVKWWRKAAEQNISRAQVGLGLALYDGKGVPQDKLEAAKWFEKAADQNEPQAQAMLAQMYLLGEGGLPASLDDACKWVAIAGDEGKQLTVTIKAIYDARAKSRAETNGPAAQRAKELCSKQLGIRVTVNNGRDVFDVYGAQKATQWIFCVIGKLERP